MSGSSFHPVITLDALREGRMHTCMLGDREVVICRTREGVFALDNICTHAEARMSEGKLRGMRLVCPLHGAAFDVRDGRVLSGPAVRPLATYETRVVDGTVEVGIDPKTRQPTST